MSQASSHRREFSFELSSKLTSEKLRVGTLSINGKTVSTPAIIPSSKRGTPPHLTRDNIERLPIDMVHMSLEHFMDFNPPAYVQAPFEMARYFGLHNTSRFPNSPLIVLGTRDPSDTVDVPYNTDSYVSIRCPLGIARITPSDFASIGSSKPPDILLALSDQVGSHNSKKRLEKSFNRSIKWLEQLISHNAGNAPIFATLLGGSSAETREDWSEVLMGPPGYSQFLINGVFEDPSTLRKIDDGISGYAVLLLPPSEHSKSNETLVPSSATGEPLTESTIDLLRASFAPLTKQKPRLVLAANGPHQILSLISQVGVDLIVDHWSATLSTVGAALDFTFPPPPTSNSPSALPIAINLFDPRYKEDASLLSSSPLTLRYPIPFNKEGTAPTRAYLHHLLMTHEMTGLVLLAMHNTVMMRSFMESVREEMERGEPTFTKACEEFYNVYDGSFKIVEQAKRDWASVERSRGKGRNKPQDGDTVVPEVPEGEVATLAGD
ncbi:tRNA-guanine transglycosylase [Atractiella rhizophila]|nr:tRNA-guanine transglycosylase [Atractiella rhizophila]